MFNAALNWRLNWEGDLRTLESQVEQALRKPDRMASSPDEALKKLRADKDLSKEFREAYGREMNGAGLLGALTGTYRGKPLVPASTPRRKNEPHLWGHAASGLPVMVHLNGLARVRLK